MNTVTVNNYCWLRGHDKKSFLIPLIPEDAEKVASVTKPVPVEGLNSKCRKKLDFTFTFDEEASQTVMSAAPRQEVQPLKVTGCIVKKPDGSTFLYVRNYPNRKHADELRRVFATPRLYYIPQIKVSARGVEVTLSHKWLQCKNFQASVEEDVSTDFEDEVDDEPQDDEATSDMNVIYGKIRSLWKVLHFSEEQENAFAKFLEEKDSPRDRHVFSVTSIDEQKVRSLLNKATLPGIADERVTVQLGSLQSSDTVSQNEKRPLNYYLLQKFFEIPPRSLPQYHAVRLLFNLAALAKVLREKSKGTP